MKVLTGQWGHWAQGVHGGHGAGHAGRPTCSHLLSQSPCRPPMTDAPDLPWSHLCHHNHKCFPETCLQNVSHSTAVPHDVTRGVGVSCEDCRPPDLGMKTISRWCTLLTISWFYIPTPINIYRIFYSERDSITVGPEYFIHPFSTSLPCIYPTRGTWDAKLGRRRSL